MIAYLGLDSAWTGALTLAAIYGVAAIGLQLALSTGQFSVMHGALVGVGEYAAGAAGLLWHEGLVVSLLVGAITAAIIGGISSWILLPLNGLFFGIASLSIGVGLSYAVQTVPDLGGPGGLSGVALDTTPTLVFVTVVVVLLIYLFFRRTSLYAAMLATGSDVVASAAVGIPTSRYRIGAFSVGAALAGLAGGLYVHYVGLAQPPDLGFPGETQLLVFLVIGGISTPFGGIVGALGVSAVLQALTVSSLERYWILGITLVVVVIFQPRGLLKRRGVRPSGREGGGYRGSERGAVAGESIRDTAVAPIAVRVR